MNSSSKRQQFPFRACQFQERRLTSCDDAELTTRLVLAFVISCFASITASFPSSSLYISTSLPLVVAIQLQLLPIRYLVTQSLTLDPDHHINWVLLPHKFKIAIYFAVVMLSRDRWQTATNSHNSLTSFAQYVCACVAVYFPSNNRSLLQFAVFEIRLFN